MVNVIPDDNPLKPALREIEQLAAYVTAYRYPTPGAGSRTDLLAASSQRSSRRSMPCFGDAASCFGVDLARKGAPAAKPKPIR